MVAAIVFTSPFPSSAWIVLHGVFGIEKWSCILLICGLTALYTVLADWPRGDDRNSGPRVIWA